MIHRLLLHYRSLSTLPLRPQHKPKPHHLLYRCNQTIQRLAELGRLTDARKVFESMSQRDQVSWNIMISAYTKNGLLHEAQTLFNAFPDKNVRTWTILIDGYAKNGLIDEARKVFDSMPERNVVSWNAMVSGYVRNGELRYARKVFDVMPERNMASWNSMITGYCHYGMVAEARELFDSMEEKNAVSWLVMISGYVEISEYIKAWLIFSTMFKNGVRLEQSTLVIALSAVTGLNDLNLVNCFRTVAIKTGHEDDVQVGTAILNAYTRNGSLELAREFFESMPERNEYSWTTMISSFSQCNRINEVIELYKRNLQKDVSIQTTMLAAFAQNGRINEARNIFNQIPIPNVVAWNAMITAYAQNGMLEEAKPMFSRMPIRNSVSWAAMIAGLVENGQIEEALWLFSELHMSKTAITHSCFTSVLFACANMGWAEAGKQIHSLTIKTRSQFNSFVGNGLISMYSKCKRVEDASQVFSTMKVKDTVSWNSLISAFADNDMLENAQRTFDQMPERDVVSWNTVISGHEKAGEGFIAFELFLDMLCDGLKPNQSTFTTLLLIARASHKNAPKLGPQIHTMVEKLGFSYCLIVSNALMTMYFKCGSNLDGLRIFELMFVRDIITWNVVLDGCVQNGLFEEAITVFEQMEGSGVLPDKISFLAILRACSRAGFVDKGWDYFNSMQPDYGITQSADHHTCMVDLLVKAGEVEEAEKLVTAMEESMGERKEIDEK